MDRKVFSYENRLLLNWSRRSRRLTAAASSAGSPYDPFLAAQDLFAMLSLHAPGAEELGFVGDRTVSELGHNVIAEFPELASTQAQDAR